MPTIRPRHLITETDEIAAALDEAAVIWPEEAERRADLLRHLVAEGHRVVSERAAQERDRRRRAIRRSAGALTGVYGADYLDSLRREWPD